jgi:acetyl esterase/lipase
MNTSVAGKVSLQREVEGAALGTGQVTVTQSEIKDLRVTDKFSDTTVEVIDATLNGRIVVVDGAGAFNLVIDNSTAARGANVFDATGDLSVSLDNSDFNGSAWLRADGAGAHSFSLQNSHVSGNVSFNSVDGVSSVYLSGNSRVTRSLSLHEDGGSSSAMIIANTSYIGTRMRHTIVGGGDNETVIRDDAIVDGLVQVSNYEGHSDVRIIERAEINRFSGSGYTTERNVEFANRDDEPLLADVYVPKSAGPHPAVIMVHGGYWRLGSKSNMADEAKELAQRGYVAISVDYRLAPDDKFPAQIHDVKSAIMWTRANAATYDIDASNIGIYGYSAGAHLALLAGLTDPSAGLEGPDAGSFGSDIKAIVAGGPATDFRDIGPNDPRFVYLFGGTRGQLPNVYDDASPAHWVSSNDPATFLFVGENDFVINRANLDQFHADLDAAGIENDFYEAPGKAHLPAANDKTSRLYSIRFLDGQLK